MTIQVFLKTLRDKCPQANFRIAGSVGCEPSDFYFPRNHLLGDPNQSVYVVGADYRYGYVTWNISQYALDNYPLVLIVLLTGYIKGEESVDIMMNQAKFQGLFV